ncbi:MAG: hypothetical protein KVP17_004007 [Porospora cf. gigantea B]|nr:MAG: hypothetical protein KVP17_004007 [Porospora cf. gigantea B]
MEDQLNGKVTDVEINGDEHDLFDKDVLPSTSLPFDEVPQAIGFEFDSTIEDVEAVNALWTSFYGCPDTAEIRRLVTRAGGCNHL